MWFTHSAPSFQPNGVQDQILGNIFRSKIFINLVWKVLSFLQPILESSHRKDNGKKIIKGIKIQIIYSC